MLLLIISLSVFTFCGKSDDPLGVPAKALTDESNGQQRDGR